jgi:murein DD-endopeptidase MepM/ murein hydrolase activator NlpD
MKASSSSGQIPWIIVKGTVILLVFVFLMAIYPQPAQAACSFKYTVQSGDSLYGIAATYQVAFEDLVELNKLIEPYVIYVGQVLCMPPGAVKPTTTTVAGTTTTSTADDLLISGVHLGNILWVGVSNFPKERIYYVNVYEGFRYFYQGNQLLSYPSCKAGQFKTDKDGKFGAWFHIGDERCTGFPGTNFEDQMRITVCIKDVITDIVKGCVQVTNYDYYIYKDK